MFRKNQWKTLKNVFAIFVKVLPSAEALFVARRIEWRFRNRKSRAPCFASFALQVHSIDIQSNFDSRVFVKWRNVEESFTDIRLLPVWVLNADTSFLHLNYCLSGQYQPSPLHRSLWELVRSATPTLFATIHTDGCIVQWTITLQQFSLDITRGFNLQLHTVPFQWALSIFCSCNASTSGGYLSSSLATMDFPSG
jgi:hypothetical protein